MRRLLTCIVLAATLMAVAAPAFADPTPRQLEAQRQRAWAQAKRVCHARPGCNHLTVWWHDTWQDCSHWFFFYFTNKTPQGWGWFELMQCPLRR